MPWNQSTDDEIGRFVAKHLGSPGAHLPFLTVYDRNHLMTLRYFQARIGRENAAQSSEQLWKQAWKEADKFLQSSLPYRSWLLELADGILAEKRQQDSEVKPTGMSRAPIVANETEVFEHAILKLSVDRRKVFCLRARGASEAEIFSELGIDEARANHWLALATNQIESTLNSPV